MRVIKHTAAPAMLAACQPAVEYSDVGYYPVAALATATASEPEFSCSEQNLRLAAAEQAMRACPPPVSNTEPETPSDFAAHWIASTPFRRPAAFSDGNRRSPIAADHRAASFGHWRTGIKQPERLPIRSSGHFGEDPGGTVPRQAAGDPAHPQRPAQSGADPRACRPDARRSPLA